MSAPIVNKRHNAIISAYRAGGTLAEIAAAFSTSRGAIGRLVNQYGVPHRRSDRARKNATLSQRARRVREAISEARA